MEAYEVDIRRINTKTSQKLEKEIREKKTTRASLRRWSLEERLSSKDDDHDIAWPDLKRVSELDLKRHRLLVRLATRKQKKGFQLRLFLFSTFPLFFFFFKKKNKKFVIQFVQKIFTIFSCYFSPRLSIIIIWNTPHLLFQMHQRFIIIFI